jgi:hypothetical protein
MKKRDGSKSPTRKMLIKKIIKYEENLKELHKYDSKKSRQQSSEANHRHSTSRSPQHNTVESKYIDELYVDEEHRKVKLVKLKELMVSELSKAETDGALNFKKEDIDKAYAGYPQFMHRYDSQRGSFDKSSLTHKDSHIKRPLIENLKEAVEDADKIYSDGELDRSESIKKQEQDQIHSRSEITITEKRLYHLEIEHHHDYSESPLKNRYEFHQRKSKEIRRLQYDATFVAKKFVPDVQNKKSLQDIPQATAKRAPPRIAPLTLRLESHQYADYRFDSPTKMELEQAEQGPTKKVSDGRVKLSKLQQRPIRSMPDRLYTNNVQPTPLDENLLVELKPSSEDNNDQRLQSESGVSVRDSHPSMVGDVLANEGDDPDYLSKHSGPTDRSHDSEPSEQESLDENPGDPLGEPNGETDHGESREDSEPSEQPEVIANDPDKPDSGKDEGEKKFQEDSEPSEEEILEGCIGDQPGEVEKERGLVDRGDSEPSDEEDLDPCANSHPVSDREQDDKISDKISEPSEQIDLDDNEQDQIDSADHENKPENDHDNSEPSDVQSFHSNKPEDNDSIDKDILNKEDDGSEIENDPDLEDNQADQNDDPNRATNQDDSIAPESEEEIILDAIPLTEALIGSCELESCKFVRPKKVPALDKPHIPASEYMYQNTERVYYQKVYKPLKLTPSKQPFSQFIERCYFGKPYDQKACECSPLNYSSTVETAYFYRIHDRKVVSPLDEEISQYLEQAKYQKIKKNRPVEASPEHRKIVETAKFQRVYDRPRIDSSPEPYAKEEVTTKFQRVFERKVCSPSASNYSQKIETSLYVPVFESFRPQPSPTPYYSIEEYLYSERAYESFRPEPAWNIFEKKIEECYYLKVFTRPRIQPSPARYEQYIERAYYQKIYRKARGVAPALIIESKLEKIYVFKVYQRKRISPLTISGHSDTCYVYRTVVWDNPDEVASVASGSRAGELAETSDYASVKHGADSELGSQAGLDDLKDHSEVADDDEEIEIYPANVDSFSSQIEQSERLSTGSHGSQGKSRRRFGRTNPDEKFPCWVLNDEREPENAFISSPEGFWIDLDNGKIEVMAGDPVKIEPQEGQKFEEVTSKARKRDEKKDPECDFIVKDEDRNRLSVIINFEKLPLKQSNCQLFDPEDNKVCRAKLRLCGRDNETGESIQYFNGVLVDENLKVSHVLVKRLDEERLLLKRSKDATTEEIVTAEEVKIVGYIPAKVVSLDPFYTQKSRAEQVYIPFEAFRVYKTPLLDSEEAKAASVEDNRIFEGPIIVEPVQGGKTHEVFMLIPPEKRDEAQVRDSYIPRYVRVEPDFEIKEEQDKFDNFKNSILEDVEGLKKKADKKPTQVAKDRPLSPKPLKPLGVDRVDLKVADLKPKKENGNIKKLKEAAEDLDESGLGYYDSLKNSEELYYEIDNEEKKASKQEFTGSRTSWKNNEKDKINNGKTDSQKNRSSIDQSGSHTSSRKQSSHSSYQIQHSQKSKTTTTTVKSPKLVEGNAKIRFDTVSEDNKKLKFIGIGKLSNPDTEKSPKKYSEQLKDLKNRAASTIQLFCLHCLKRPEWRHAFNKKYRRAKTELADEALFRRFLLHYVCLQSQVSVDKALENYLKILSKSHK